MTAIATIETKISCLDQSSPRHHRPFDIETYIGTFTYCCCCWLVTAAAVPTEKGQVSERSRPNPGGFLAFGLTCPRILDMLLTHGLSPGSGKHVEQYNGTPGPQRRDLIGKVARIRSVLAL